MSDFIGVRHVGLPAKNLAAIAAFYRDVMGMTITRENSADAPYGASVFLARHPVEEDHDLVFFENPTLAHTAFRVASLGELKTWYRRIKERGMPIKFALNHGTEFSFYFDDPEGHMIEIYWSTNLPIRQALADPIDLDRPEGELLREVERLARQFGLPTSSTSS
ncbi:MAG: VOC family protein [Planctomycetaceae bacterium]|nr:VOC family protein [Planctomycetaceae bacterium]